MGIAWMNDILLPVISGTARWRGQGSRAGVKSLTGHSLTPWYYRVRLSLAAGPAPSSCTPSGSNILQGGPALHGIDRERSQALGVLAIRDLLPEPMGELVRCLLNQYP